MTKLTREQRLEIYELRKKGESISNLSKVYNISADKIWYLIRLIDMHGYNILRKDKNNYYSPKLKQEAIDRVLIQNEKIS